MYAFLALSGFQLKKEKVTNLCERHRYGNGEKQVNEMEPRLYEVTAMAYMRNK